MASVGRARRGGLNVLVPSQRLHTEMLPLPTWGDTTKVPEPDPLPGDRRGPLGFDDPWRRLGLTRLAGLVA